MLIYYKNKNDQGFTLMELLVVLFIMGIIATISVPSFVGLLNRFRVNTAISTLVGAIKETQRQAMSGSLVCKININTNTNILSGNPGRCLLRDRIINNEVEIRTNIPGSNPNISFSHKGNTTKMGTIIISKDNTNLQRCFVIALGTGITRTGEYIGSKTGSVSATNCKKQN